MTYREHIREGIRLIHRNWQLIIIQFIMSVITCIGFFLIVGIPLLIAVMSLGFDGAEITRLKDFLLTLENPLELLKKYLGIGILLLAVILIYVLFAFSVWVYVFGGSCHTIGRSIREPLIAFNLREFLREAKRLFLPLMGLTALVGLLFIVGVFVLGIFGGGMVAVLTTMDIYSSFGQFMKVFFGLLLLVIGLILTFLAMTVTLYGSAILVLRGMSPIQSLKGTYRYFKMKPSSVGFFVVAFSGYILIYILLFLIGYSLRFIPLVGAVIFLPYQLFLYIIQGYLNLVLVAVVFQYYSATSEGSTSLGGISL